jgi:hypothetical protein
MGLPVEGLCLFKVQADLEERVPAMQPLPGKASGGCDKGFESLSPSIRPVTLLEPLLPFGT